MNLLLALCTWWLPVASVAASLDTDLTVLPADAFAAQRFRNAAQRVRFLERVGVGVDPTFDPQLRDCDVDAEAALLGGRENSSHVMAVGPDRNRDGVGAEVARAAGFSIYARMLGRESACALPIQPFVSHSAANVYFAGMWHYCHQNRETDKKAFEVAEEWAENMRHVTSQKLNST